MKFFMRRRTWRPFYAVCCIIYVGWVGYQGSFDLGRVHREYSRAGEQLEPGRIHTAALRDLSEECWKRSARQLADIAAAEKGLTSGVIAEGSQADQDCSTWPQAVVEAREAKIRGRLEERQKRAGKKMLYFSAFFVVIFLILPPALVYVFVLLIVKVFQAVKIVRKG
jgi:NAD-specific glutamate dehydrogenase